MSHVSIQLYLCAAFLTLKDCAEICCLDWGIFLLSSLLKCLQLQINVKILPLYLMKTSQSSASSKSSSLMLPRKNRTTCMRDSKLVASTFRFYILLRALLSLFTLSSLISPANISLQDTAFGNMYSLWKNRNEDKQTCPEATLELASLILEVKFSFEDASNLVISNPRITD